jgi:DNA polymerase-3 subunit delta'
MKCAVPFDQVLGQSFAVDALRRALANKRLHHALLFVGPDGVGKELTAFALATAIVCVRAPLVGCGQCDGCRKVAARSEGGVPLHPDVVLVEKGLYPKDVLGRSTDEKVDISVDQIRRVVLERIAIPPNESPERIIIVRRAEELSVGAANALLKTLEEPPSHTRFVLITSHAGELLPTIRSRTLPLRFAPLADDVVERILRADGVDASRAKEIAALAGGSVEIARTLADPRASEARTSAVDALSDATRTTLPHLLEATSEYANTSDDRERLRTDLTAFAATEATKLRALVMSNAPSREVDASLKRHAAAIEVTTALEKNANVPLALESAWLRFARKT